jgi:hypothetical protein
MAGLEADTSSYRQPLPTSPLDTVQKFQAVEQGKQQIDAGKMQNANTALQHMTRAMTSLGPDATKQDYAAVAENAVRQGLVPKEQLNVYMERLQKAPDAKSFFNEFATAAATLQQQLNYHLGTPGEVGNGQTVTPVVTSQKPGFGQRPIGLPVQQQAPPTSTAFDENGQPRALGAQPAQLAPGTVAGPTPLPTGRPAEAPISPRPLPVQRISGPTGETVRRTDLEPTTFDNRFPQPRGAAAGAAPLFEKGKELYATDQQNASNRAQSIKPAIQALKLIPGLATGPGTDQFTNLVAAAKAWGIVDTKAENDPTVLRQELNKKLAQYVGGSPIAQRSDAAQTLAEAGSPNPKVQLTQALTNLTRDAIALDRVQILKPQAFKGQKFDEYVKHTGNFPQSVDEKALTLDLMDEKERNKVVTKMKSDYKNGDATSKKKAVKFFETLQLAKDAKLYDAGD